MGEFDYDRQPTADEGSQQHKRTINHQQPYHGASHNPSGRRAPVRKKAGARQPSTNYSPTERMRLFVHTKALSPFSSVRIRTESSIVATKILPSPILPVLAAVMMA